MNESPLLLCLGAGVWQLPFLDACRKLGYGVIAVDLDPEAPGFEFAELPLNVSAHDPDAIFDALRHTDVELERISAVLTTASRGCIPAAADLASKLGIIGPGLPATSAADLVDRERFRSELRAAGLPTPEFEIVETADQISLAPPLVVKATVGTSGCNGVTLVRDAADLEAAVVDAQRAGGTSRVIVEALLPGQDLGVFALFSEGEPQFYAVIDRFVGGAPSFLPHRYVCPASLVEGELVAVEKAIRDLGVCFGIECGPFYVEFKLTPDGQCIAIEAEPTVPAHVDYLVSNATGQPLSLEVVRSLLGHAPEPIDGRFGNAGCCFAFAPEAGRIASIAPAIEPQGPERLLLRKQSGDAVENSSLADLCAVFYATGDTRHSVIRRLDAWRDGFRITMQEPE